MPTAGISSTDLNAALVLHLSDEVRSLRGIVRQMLSRCLVSGQNIALNPMRSGVYEAHRLDDGHTCHWLDRAIEELDEDDW